jgi:hypothetical protein
MSYCRWTDVGGSVSDLYAYEAAGPQWTVHVASSRISERGSRSGVLPRAVPIGLPFDGQSFTDPSLDAFRARIVQLRDAGYRVPDYVLAQIDEEMSRPDERPARPVSRETGGGE